MAEHSRSEMAEALRDKEMVVAHAVEADRTPSAVFCVVALPCLAWSGHALEGISFTHVGLRVAVQGSVRCCGITLHRPVHQSLQVQCVWNGKCRCISSVSTDSLASAMLNELFICRRYLSQNGRLHRQQIQAREYDSRHGLGMAAASSMRPRSFTSATSMPDYHYGGAYYGDAGAGYGGSVSSAMSASPLPPPGFSMYQESGNAAAVPSSSAGMPARPFVRAHFSLCVCVYVCFSLCLSVSLRRSFALI